MKRIIAILTAFFMMISIAEAEGFLHPGILSTEYDLKRIKAAVEDEREPYASGWDALYWNNYANYNWSPRAVETIVRSAGSDNNIALLYIDVQRAWQCAVKWKIGGDERYAVTAARILNEWAKTLKVVTGSADRYLAAGLFGYQLANCAEIMRDYPMFDEEAMKDMLLNVFYKPLNERFLYGNEYGKDHNDAHIQNYWANWDLCNMASAMAIGIFLDDREIFDRAVEYFKYGAGNGSIYNAIPYVFDEGLAQWQESGRDQGHTQLGIGLMASCCEMAWNQGTDLYGWANNRFMYAAEYVARYNNGYDVPFEPYSRGTGQGGKLETNSGVSELTRGERRAVWEMIYNHYHQRLGYDVPNIEEMVLKLRPEGGAYGGGHATTHDQPGFGTLMYTRELGDRVDASLPGGSVESGIYKLRVKHSGKLMTENNGRVIQKSVGAQGQTWKIIHLGGGQYKIMSLGGKALTVENSSYDNNAEAVTARYKGTNNQKFALIPSDGCYRIIPAHSAKPLGARSMGMEDGVVINQYMTSFNDNQMWSLERVGDAEDEEEERQLTPKREQETFEEPEEPRVRFARTQFESVYMGNIFSGKAEIEFDMTAAEDNTNALVGFCAFDVFPSDWKDFNMAVRMNEKGYFDARDGQAYAAEKSIRYKSGETYHVKIKTDTVGGVYSVYIDGEPLIRNADYRKESPQRNIARCSVMTGAGFESGNAYIENFKAWETEGANEIWPNKKFKTCDISGSGEIFEIEYDIKAYTNADGFVGLTGGEPKDWADYAIAVRIQPDGYFDAIDGSEYKSETAVSYAAGEAYRVRIIVNEKQGTYTAYAAKKGEAEALIAKDYAFRETAAGEPIDKASVLAGSGSYTDSFSVMNMKRTGLAVDIEYANGKARLVSDSSVKRTVYAAGIKDGEVTKTVRIELSSDKEVTVPDLGESDLVRFLMWSGMEPMNVKREFFSREFLKSE